MSMSPRHYASALLWLCAAWLGGLFTAAHAHDTIIFDPVEAAKISINGTWGQSTPIVLHGQATATLRPEALEIDLTMADGAAYKLLDPNQATTGVATATTDVTDAQFAKDKPLFIERARSFFKIANNGAELKIGSVSVELTTARDTIFHLIFPSPAPGTLDLGLTYLGQIPAGEKDLITVLDGSGTTLGSATLGADNPSLEVSIPTPGALLPAEQARSIPWLIFGAGAITVAAVLGLLSKLRKAGPGR